MLFKIVNPGHKKLGILLFGLLLAGAAFIWYIFNDKHADTLEQKADFALTANDLIKEFKQGSNGANAKYVEKIISVSGIVTEIENADTTANIKMTDPETGDYIIFAFQQQHQEETKKLQEGMHVTIKGSCSGAVYSEILGINFISFKRAVIIN